MIQRHRAADEDVQPGRLLFAQHRVIRKPRGNERPESLLGRHIRGRHQIDGAFLLNPAAGGNGAGERGLRRAPLQSRWTR